MPQRPTARSYAILALTLFGMVCTLFGGIVFAVPLWFMEDIVARGDCTNHCVPPAPGEHTITMHVLGVLPVSFIVGFLPLILYLLVSSYRCGDGPRTPTQSDHPHEL